MNADRLRIGVDLKPLLAQRTGVGKYQASLMAAVLRAHAGVEYVGFGDRGWRDIDARLLAEPPEGGVAGARARLVALVRRAPFAQSLYQAARGALYARSASSAGARFFHAFLYRPPAFGPMPFVPVIYDLSNKRVPEHHPPERLRWMEKLDAYVAQAPAIHTISRFTRDEIVDVYGAPRDKIHVIEPGVDPVFLSPAGPGRALGRLALAPRSYFLSVATLEPRKNLATLIAAFAALPAPVREACPLVLVGARGWAKALPPQTQRLIESGRVRLAGYVSDADLRDLYAGACAMLYASTYEGFGMPIAEARATGAPVLASDIPPHREAGGEGARFIAARDVDAWARAMQEAFEAREKTRDQGCVAFSWEESARKTLALYERVAQTL
jgi:glycosyltransferase involved in cell wall biosynthesis